MSAILRPGLLEGASLLLHDLAGSGLEPALTALGADVRSGDVAESGRVDALVVDCSGWVPDGVSAESLQQLLSQVWETVAAAANHAFIPGGQGGRILFIAPADRHDLTSPAAAAALENLGRTLSVEWARYRITVCTLAPSAATSEADLANVVGYLLSPAGAYFSGARLDLNSLTG